jgi:hypothetical protein
MGGLIGLLIWLLVFAVVMYIIYLVLNLIPLPEPVKHIAIAVFGLIFFLVLLQRVFGWGGANWGGF